MNVIRHDDIAVDNKAVAEAQRLQRMFKQFPRCRCAEMFESVITAERDEMKAAALLVTNKPFWHEFILHPKSLIRLSENKRQRVGVPRPPHLKIEMWATQLYSWSDLGHPPPHAGGVVPSPELIVAGFGIAFFAGEAGWRKTHCGCTNARVCHKREPQS